MSQAIQEAPVLSPKDVVLRYILAEQRQPLLLHEIKGELQN